MNRREAFLGSLALAGLEAPGLVRAVTNKPRTTPRHSFTPGQEWLDTAGKPIQAHGACIIEVDGAFYWYGENKEFTTGETDVYTWGIRCYRSTDLYNWDDAGLIIPPNLEDRSSPLHPGHPIDRPHIIYNTKTRKFVCWLKIMAEGRQTRTVLSANKITGPYELIHSAIQPLGMNAGDFDLVVSPDDGKAYMYFERVHSELICADLTDDYLDLTGYYSTHFPRSGPPLVREGPAYFKRRGQHFLASSGTTGYYPNPSEIAVAETFHGPFTTLGNLHPYDRSRTSCNSQISAIFKHPKKDLYIALADRWMGPLSGEEFESGKASALVQSGYRKRFASPPEQMTADEARMSKIAGTLQVNTSKSSYVWLPLQFDGNRPFIEWRSEWTLDEFS